MQKHGRFLGKWELGCIVFHVCIIKLFLSFSLHTSWLSVLMGGLLFLFLLAIIMRTAFLPKGKLWRFYCWVVGIYWIYAAVSILKHGSALLQDVAYFQSPLWFIMLFLLLGALIPALCGKAAVYRMHALTVLPIGLVLFVLVVFGLKQGTVRNLFPFWDAGGLTLLRQGLKSLLFYLDVPFLLSLFPEQRNDVPTGKIVLSAASLAVLWNVLLSFSLCYQIPYEARTLSLIPLHTLAKSGVGLEALYLLALISSLTLYLTLALHLIARIPFSKKRFGTGMLCFLLCISLSGCYDSREVEETAYLIALGIDSGENQDYRYTFQISNPLKTGSSDAQGSQQQPSEESKKDENQGVNHITVDSQNLYLALSGLRSQLGKEPDLSHLKVIVFSKNLAKTGIFEEAMTLAELPKVRPDTKLCLSDSAGEFLSKVKPTLEESTARYYDLLFQERYSPYAPISTLKELLTHAKSTARDPVLPVSDTTRLEGIGIFDGENLVYEGTSYQAGLYRILTGDATNLTLLAEDSVFSLSSKQKSTISIDRSVNPPVISVAPALTATLLTGKREAMPHLAAKLTEDMTTFLRETASLGADMLGLGETERQSSPSVTAWETLSWEDTLKHATIFTKINMQLKE